VDVRLEDLVVQDRVTQVLQVRDGLGEAVAEADLSTWLLTQGRNLPDLAMVFDAFCWRLSGNGIPIWRASLHGFTLHPQMRGMGLRWWKDQAVVEEFIVNRGAETDDEFAASPIRKTVSEGVFVRLKPTDAQWSTFPLLRRLGGLGVTDYLVFPIGQFNERSIATTFATLAEGGFNAAQVATIEAAMPALGAIVETHLLKRVAIDLLDTYLGRAAGRRVFAGEILRGEGAGVRAIIMATDLRDFTRISDLLPPGDIIELLNDYFECVGSAVRAEGGEVLKFIGDGVLAIFPVEEESQGVAALRVTAAARAILTGLDALNQTRAWSELPILKAGIGLHIGDVIFGNVGAQDRLDFTVIGPAVNLAFRLEDLTKHLGIPIIVSAALAHTAPQQFTSLGPQTVRGIDQPLEVFGLAALQATQNHDPNPLVLR
jgi:adenylate cyclase